MNSTTAFLVWSLSRKRNCLRSLFKSFITLFAISRVIRILCLTVFFVIIVVLIKVVIIIVEICHVDVIAGGRFLLGLDAVLLHSQGHHNLVFSGLRNRSADLFPDDVLVLFVLPLALLPSSVHHAGIYIGRAGCVGFIEEADHTQQNSPNILSWVPSLAGQLPRLRIVYWRVEDGDAEVAILVDVRVPDFRKES